MHDAGTLHVTGILKSLVFAFFTLLSAHTCRSSASANLAVPCGIIVCFLLIAYDSDLAISCLCCFFHCMWVAHGRIFLLLIFHYMWMTHCRIGLLSFLYYYSTMVIINSSFYCFYIACCLHYVEPCFCCFTLYVNHLSC